MSKSRKSKVRRLAFLVAAFYILSQATAPIAAVATTSDETDDRLARPYDGWTVGDTAAAVVVGGLAGAAAGAFVAVSETCLVGVYGGVAAGAAVGGVAGAVAGYVAYAGGVAIGDGAAVASAEPYPETVFDGQG